MSSLSSSSSFPPVAPQLSLNVPILSEFLRGEEGQCRLWLRTEMNQIHDKLIESLFSEQNGSSSSSSLFTSSSAVPSQHRQTVPELCELLEGKKVETRMVMRGEMDRVVNDLFEGLTNKLRAYSDLDRSEDGGDGYGARVDSLDDDQLEPSSNDHQPNASVLPQQSPKSTWKPRLFTQHEMDTEFEEGNVAELFAELGLPYDDEQQQQQQSNHQHNNTQQLEEDEVEVVRDGDIRAGDAGPGDGHSSSVVKKRMTKRRIQEQEEEKEVEVVDVSGDEDDSMPSWSVKRLRSKRPTTLSGTPNVKSSEGQVITVYRQCDQADCEVQLPKGQYDQHLWQRHSIRLVRCLVKDCKQSFHNQHLLTRHLAQAHQSTRRWHCDKCEQHFTEYKKLSVHNFHYHQLGQFQCSFPACPFTGEYHQKVYSHYATQHKKQFVCLVCNYETRDAATLKRHEQGHLPGNKPYRCTWLGCHFASADKSYTIRHIGRHIELNSASGPTGAQPDPKDYLEKVNE